jgi:hypothetical protein
MLQLNPAIPIMVRKGDVWSKALAHIMIDPGIESDILWVCFLDTTGECWTLRNQDVRAQKNVTIGRTLDGMALAPLCPEPEVAVLDRAARAIG